MTEEQVFDLLSSSKEVSSLPQVLAEVIRVTNKEESSPKELGTIVAKDPALTARLLRVVNSPLYPHTREITTINQAVIALGMRAVKAIVLSTGIYRMFESQNAVIDRMRFWRHSLETAIACREIAKACGYKSFEEAFVVGLIHDIGLLIIENNFPQQFKRIIKKVEEGQSLITLEQAAWGTNHARTGKFLIDHWKLPEFMGNAIGHHHDDFSDQTLLPELKLARIVCLGNLISKFNVFDEPNLDNDALDNIDILAESLGISPIALIQMQSKILDMLPKESEFLEIKIGSVTDLLEAANNLISRQYFLMEKALKDNRRMQKEIARDEVKKAALESLKTIAATMSHYINNASSTILGRVQLVELAISNGSIQDKDNIAANSMKHIEKSVTTISQVLRELKKMASFDITAYSDWTSILDIEDSLKEHIETLEKK